MVVIVASILLAFAIDAWWQNGQERKAVAEYRNLLSVQMNANRVMLEDQIADASRSKEVLGEASRAISPNPPPIPAQSK